MYQLQQALEIPVVMESALATGLVISLCTVQVRTGQQTADGSPIQTGGDSGDGWNNVSGMVNIQCMDGPEADARIRARTERSIDYVEAFQFRHLFMAGYYAVEQFDDWRVLVDGQAYDPIGVEHDSQHTQTRLLLQLAGV